jgi:hypothetical protein
MAEVVLNQIYAAHDCCERIYGVPMQAKIDRLNAFADNMLPDLFAYDDLWHRVHLVVDLLESDSAEKPADIEKFKIAYASTLSKFYRAYRDIHDRMWDHCENCIAHFGRTYGAFRSWVIMLKICNERCNWAARRNLLLATDNADLPAYMNEHIIMELSSQLCVKHKFEVYDEWLIPFNHPNDCVPMNEGLPEEAYQDEPLHEAYDGNPYPFYIQGTTGVDSLGRFLWDRITNNYHS